MKGENSIERAERMIKDLDQEIEFLRGCEVDAREHLEEVSKEYRKAKEDLENIEDQKLDALYTKMALKEFIQNGGGLDMYVD
jgi:inactivated superfamily I helicase